MFTSLVAGIVKIYFNTVFIEFIYFVMEFELMRLFTKEYKNMNQIILSKVKRNLKENLL